MEECPHTALSPAAYTPLGKRKRHGWPRLPCLPPSIQACGGITEGRTDLEGDREKQENSYLRAGFWRRRILLPKLPCMYFIFLTELPCYFEF